jgi:hypothetical protein
MLPLIASLAGGLNADQAAVERIRNLCRARRGVTRRRTSC